MSRSKPYELKRIDHVRWEIPRTGKMRVPGLIYADQTTIPDIKKDNAADQVYNVAHLPGIVGRSLAMPDVHWGYGFPIGGVAAFDMDQGVVSPGGVGYDINCGVRLAVTGLYREDAGKRIRDMVDALFANVPAGVGSKGGVKLGKSEMNKVMKLGAQWAIQQGMGDSSDLEKIEEFGGIEGADPAAVSDRAYERGKMQLGTLGAGNHFMEIGFVEEIYDEETARVWGVQIDQITLMIHSGSRGFGHQICDDYLARMVKSMAKEKLDLPDKQLACTKLQSSLAKEYLAAMNAAANFAFANRQILMNLARNALEKSLGLSPRELQLRLLYDVCHNMAKIETHLMDGKNRKLCVHRKGATRAFPAGHPVLPAIYRSTGHPVLIPGDMGRASYVLAGQQGSLEETFGSACHGAGRLLSRGESLRKTKGRAIERELMDEMSVYARSVGRKDAQGGVPRSLQRREFSGGCGSKGGSGSQGGPDQAVGRGERLAIRGRGLSEVFEHAAPSNSTLSRQTWRSKPRRPPRNSLPLFSFLCSAIRLWRRPSPGSSPDSSGPQPIPPRQYNTDA